MDLTPAPNPMSMLDTINMRGLNPSTRRAIESVKAQFKAAQMMMQAQMAATTLTLSSLVQEFHRNDRSSGFPGILLDDDDVKPDLRPGGALNPISLDDDDEDKNELQDRLDLSNRSQNNEEVPSSSRTPIQKCVTCNSGPIVDRQLCRACLDKEFIDNLQQSGKQKRGSSPKNANNQSDANHSTPIQFSTISGTSVQTPTFTSTPTATNQQTSTTTSSSLGNKCCIECHIRKSFCRNLCTTCYGRWYKKSKRDGTFNSLTPDRHAKKPRLTTETNNSMQLVEPQITERPEENAELSNPAIQVSTGMESRAQTIQPTQIHPQKNPHGQMEQSNLNYRSNKVSCMDCDKIKIVAQGRCRNCYQRKWTKKKRARDKIQHLYSQPKEQVVINVESLQVQQPTPVVQGSDITASTTQIVPNPRPVRCNICRLPLKGVTGSRPKNNRYCKSCYKTLASNKANQAKPAKEVKERSSGQENQETSPKWIICNTCHAFKQHKINGQCNACYEIDLMLSKTSDMDQ